MSFITICYYPEGSSGPVKDYLDGLAVERPAAYVKLALDLEILGAEGLRSKQITIRPLGQGLWELKRLFEGTQFRIFFCVERGLRLARKRMRGI